MRPDKDWEAQLKDGLFDLPKERWAAMETDLLRKVRAQAHQPTPIPWYQSFLGKFSQLLRPAPIAIGFASLFISVGWWFLHQESIVPKVAGVESLEHWNSGEVLQADSIKTWNWNASRCTLTLAGKVRRLESPHGVRLRLEQGDVRFGVNPRKNGESFVVEFGHCEATVVGTAFSLHYDSAKTSAFVEHGKVRVTTKGGRETMLLGGESMLCQDPARTKSSIDSALAVPTVQAPPPKANHLPKTSTVADPQWTALNELCASSEARCIDALANYLQKQPSGEHAAQAGLRWARLAQKKGDLRDALYALELASAAQGGDASLEARLQICVLQAQQLGKVTQARQNLEALLLQLPAQSQLRTRAEQLRTELTADAH